jgi:hypothetical protein
MGHGKAEESEKRGLKGGEWSGRVRTIRRLPQHLHISIFTNLESSTMEV